MFTFTSVPSRVLMARVLPSTLSMVPRMRTVGAGCAETDTMETTAHAATTARGIQLFSFDMIVPSRALRWIKHGNPASPPLFPQLFEHDLFGKPLHICANAALRVRIMLPDHIGGV